MKEREIEILKIILLDEYIDTNVISERLEISVRTVRYSISQLRSILDESDCELLYSRNKGYYFSKQHGLKVKLLIHQFSKYNISLTNYHHRQSYMLGILLFEGKLNIDKVASVSYTQDSTIKKDIRVLNKQLIKYGSQIVRVNDGAMLSSYSLDLVSRIFINKLSTKTIEMSEFYNKELALLMYGRFNDIEFKSIVDYCVSNDLYRFNTKLQIQLVWYAYFIYSLKIKQDINQLLDMNILEYFKHCLTIEDYDTFSKYFKCLGYNQPQKYEDSYNDMMSKFFNILAKDYKIEYSEEDLPYKQLGQKLVEVKLRHDNQIDIWLKNTDRIIRLYPYSFSLSQQLLAFTFKKVKFSRDEVAYICEEVQQIMFESTKSLSIVIVANQNLDIIEYYKQWITYQYTKNVRLVTVDFNKVQNLIENDESSVKLILNFEPIKVKTEITQIMLSNAISYESMQKIDYVLKKENGNSKFLSKFFQQNLLKIYMNETTFDQILRDSCRKIYCNGYVSSNEKLYKGCIAREEISPTYIGYETMLIHPINYSSNRNIVFVNITHEPIEVEGFKCRIFFLCCFKQEIDFEISRLFENILRIVESDKYRNRLINSQSELDLVLNIGKVIEKI